MTQNECGLNSRNDRDSIRASPFIAPLLFADIDVCEDPRDRGHEV